MIRHKTARRLADEWHGGQWTGLYALASSGAIIVNRDFSRIPATFINDDGERVLTDDPDTIATLTAENEILDELAEKYRHPTAGPLSTADKRDLMRLLEYVRHYGPRGPVDGWSNLNW